MMMPSTKDEIAEMKDVPYQSFIGTLMYLVVSIRSDISHTVSVLSQFNKNPERVHWSSAKRVLRYLQGTRNYGLCFRKTKSNLIGYVDAYWGGDIDDTQWSESRF